MFALRSWPAFISAALLVVVLPQSSARGQAIDLGAILESPPVLSGWSSSISRDSAAPGVIQQSSESPAPGGSSVRLRLMPGITEASITAVVGGTGELSFWWKTDIPAAGGAIGTVSLSGLDGGVFGSGGAVVHTFPAPSFSAGWKQERIPVFHAPLIPGRAFHVTWKISTADHRIAALWVDGLSFTPAPAITPAEALDSPPVNIEFAGGLPLPVPGASGGTAFASASIQPPSSSMLSLHIPTGPHVLTYRVWSGNGTDSPASFGFQRGPAIEEIAGGSPLSIGVWQTRRLYLPQPDMRVSWLSFPGLALDAISLQPLTGNVSLSEAADHAGDWSGGALGLTEPHASSDGTDGILLTDEARLAVTGPGIVRWQSRGVVSVSSDAAGTRSSATSTAWETREHVVGAGPRMIRWYPSDSGLIDRVVYSPSLPIEDVLESGPIPLSVTGAVCGVPTPGGGQGDGVDAALLTQDGTVSTTLTGPGLLRFWCGAAITVDFNGVPTDMQGGGWHEVDLTGSTVILWRGTASAPGSASMLDSVSFTPGEAARWGERLGTAPDYLWHMRSPVLLETVATDGITRIRPFAAASAAPVSLKLLSRVGIPPQFLVRTRFTGAPGLSLATVSNPTNPGSQNLSQAFSPAFIFRQTALPLRLDITNQPDRTGTWEMEAPRILPIVDSGSTLEEALESTLVWSALSQPVLPLTGFPGGGDDGVLISSGGRIQTTVTGPAYLAIHSTGSVAVRVDNVVVNGSVTDKSGTHYLVGAGTHILSVTGGHALIERIEWHPFVPTAFPGLDSTLSFTAPPASFGGGLRTPVASDAGESWDGEAALNFSGAALSALAPSRGFLTFRVLNGLNVTDGTFNLTSSPTDWQLRTLPARNAAGTPFTFSNGGLLDVMKFDPLVPETLEEAADASGLTFTVNPADGWQGFRGSGVSLDGGDAIGRSALTPGAGVTLSTDLPSAGTLTWWWRADRTPLSAASGSTSYASSSNEWRFGIARRTAAGTYTWTSQLPADTATSQPAEGSAWIDSIAWKSGTLSRPEAADAPSRVFTASSTDAWTAEPAAFAKNRNVLYAGSTWGWLQTSFTGPATLSFSAFVRSRTGYIQLTPAASPGVTLLRTGRECLGTWHRYTLRFGAGTHSVRWLNQLSDSTSSVYFLDDIEILPLPPADGGQVAEALEYAPAVPADVVSAAVTTGTAAHDGSDALRIGAVSSAGRTAFGVPRGSTVSFWWAAPSDLPARLKAGSFSMGGLPVAAIRAGTPWTEFRIDTPPGPGTIILEWASLPGAVLDLDGFSLTPYAPQQTPGDAVSGPGITWLGDPSAPGAWFTAGAVSVDGACAASSGPGLAEMDCTGPGWLVIDTAAAGMSVSLNGAEVMNTPPGSPPMVISHWPDGRTGFFQTVIPLPAGTHRCRITSPGLLYLDKARVLAAPPPQQVYWHTTATVDRDQAGDATLLSNSSASSGVTGEAATWLAGPGTLTFNWGTMGSHSMAMDGQFLQIFFSTTAPFRELPMRIDIPEGLHRFSIRVGGVSLSDAVYAYGRRDLAQDGGVSGMDCHSIGNQWSAAGGVLTAPQTITGIADFVARCQGPARVSLRPEAAGANALFFNGIEASPVPGIVKSWLIPRRGLIRTLLEPGLKVVTDLSGTLLTEVPVDTALELPAGWTVNSAPASPWLGISHGDTAAPVGGHSAMAFVNGLEPPAILTLTPPASGGSVLFRAGLWQDLPGANGTLLCNDQVAYTLLKKDALENFAADLPAGGNTIAFKAESGQSAAVDALSALPSATTTRIGDVLGSPELPWIARLRGGTRADLFPAGGALPVIRLADVAGVSGPDLLLSAVSGAGLLEIGARATGSAGSILVNGVTYSVPASGDTQNLLISVREKGALRILTGSGGTLEIHRVAFRPGETPSPSADPRIAADAGDLVASFSTSWKTGAEPGIARDASGYAQTLLASRLDIQAPQTLGVLFLNIRCASGYARITYTVPGTYNSITVPLLTGQAWQQVAIRPKPGASVSVEYSQDEVGTYGSVDIALDGLLWTPDNSIPSPQDLLTDTDGDGISALLEAGFGLNSGVADRRYAGAASGPSGLPSLSTGGNDSEFSLVFVRRTTGIRYTPEFSASLDSAWQPLTGAIEILEQYNSLWEVCRVPAPPGMRFGRIRLQLSAD